MNFEDSPQEAAFRAECRAWIEANAPHELAPELHLSTFGGLRVTSVEPVAAAKAWQRRKYDAGYACIHWPKEYGGRGATPIERVIWQQEEGVYARLSTYFGIGMGMCGPTVMAHADEATRRRLLPRLASGEDIWCQLFSEPAAGSDVAGLRTRAERDGDGWKVNGQKIWTSGAHLSDYGLLFARTDPTVPKHKGLTMFWIDMHAPGVEVRPIKQMNGDQYFNEVYFTDLRVPDSQRLGEVGQGWQVSLTTLMNERQSIMGSMPTGFPEIYDMCCRYDTGAGLAIDDPLVRSRLATWAVRTTGLQYTAYRTISSMSRGETPGPENSIGKLVAGITLQEVAKFALDLQGRAGAIVDPELGVESAWFQALLLRSPGARIEGGSDEIMRNIIAERVLGLPADIRVDKDVPYNQIPTRGRR
ncbi:MAG: acyl-CoA dehydrogenase family protein [Gammaproteobacteria bacterium]